MILRAVKVRLYPNKEQQTSINKTLGCYRTVYNHMLERKINAYKDNQTNLGLNELSKYFHGELLKNEEHSYLKEQNTKVMKQAIRQMMNAYKNFFEGKGFPKFKSKHEDNSCLFEIQTISKKNTFDTKHITLAGLKNLKFRCSNRQFERIKKYKSSIRSATLTRTKSGKYFLSILFAMNNDEFKQFKHTGNRVGIDLGVKDFVITSDGEMFENKHFFKKTEKRIKRLQKQLSKKVKGSKNRNKVRKKLAVVYEKQTNQRRDYIYQIVNSLLRSYDFIFMENLNVQGMLKNHKLSKSIQELGFYTFKSILKDKALMNDKYVIEVDRWFPSSKTCSVCGYVYRDLTLDEREWLCPDCGTIHNRDLNAAVNILHEGERIIGCSPAEFTLAENPTMDDRLGDKRLKSSGSLKQETESEQITNLFRFQ